MNLKVLNMQENQQSKEGGAKSSNQPLAAGSSVGHYILGKTLGEGTFGKVKLGTHILTGEKVAVKVLEKSKIKDKKDVERISREIKILKRLHHPNVVQIYEIIETERDLYLVMEYASGGELFDLIVANQRLKETKASKHFQELVAGVHYIHKLGICHRDLKPENLLVDFDGSLKVVDFGLSNMYEPGQTLKTACGSPCYAAPEMIAGHKYHGLKSDIWSIGVVLYAMLCGYLPYEDQKTSNLYKKILSAEYSLPKFLSSDAKDILARIFVTDPDQRINIEELRRHPFYLLNQPENQNFSYHTRKLNVNTKLVQKMESTMGFSSSQIETAVQNNKHNHLSATYYLLLKKYTAQAYKLKETHPTIAANQTLSHPSTSNNTTSVSNTTNPNTSQTRQSQNDSKNPKAKQMTSIDSNNNRTSYSSGPSKPLTTTNHQSSSQRQRNTQASNHGSTSNNTRGENNLQAGDDHIKAPVTDQLVLKNYRREQSANATAGRGRQQTAEAWGDEPLDDRRCGSYERPDKNEDYQIVGQSISSKENNRYQPVTGAANSSSQPSGQNGSTQAQSKSEHRSKFVSPSPDPPAKKESVTTSNAHSRRKGSSTQQATQFLNASYIRPSREIQAGVLNQSTNLNLQNMKQQIQSISSHPHHHTVLSSMMGQNSTIANSSSHQGHATSKSTKQNNSNGQNSIQTQSNSNPSSTIHSSKASTAHRTSASASRATGSSTHHGSSNNHNSNTQANRKSKSSSVDPNSSSNAHHHQGHNSHQSQGAGNSRDNHSRHHNSLSQTQKITSASGHNSKTSAQKGVNNQANSSSAAQHNPNQTQNLTSLMNNLSLITNPANTHPNTSTIQSNTNSHHPQQSHQNQSNSGQQNPNNSASNQQQFGTKSYFDSFVNKHLASGKAANQTINSNNSRDNTHNTSNRNKHANDTITSTGSTAAHHQNNQNNGQNNSSQQQSGKNSFYQTQTIHSSAGGAGGGSSSAAGPQHPSSTKSHSLPQKAQGVGGTRGATARNSVAYHPSSSGHQDRIGSVQGNAGDHLNHTMGSFHPTSAASRTIEADSFRASLGGGSTTHNAHHHQGHDHQSGPTTSHQGKKNSSYHPSNSTHHGSGATHFSGSLNMNSISAGRPAHPSGAGAHSTRHDATTSGTTTKGNTKSKRPQSSNVKGSTNLRNPGSSNHTGASDGHQISSNANSSKQQHGYAIPTQTFSELEQRKRGNSQKVSQQSTTIQASSMSKDHHNHPSSNHHSVQRQSLQPKLSSTTHADRRNSVQGNAASSNARTSNNLYKSYEKPSASVHHQGASNSGATQHDKYHHQQVNLNSSLVNGSGHDLDLSASYKANRRAEDNQILLHNNFTNALRTENSMTNQNIHNEPIISSGFVGTKSSSIYTPESNQRGVRLSSTFNSKSYSTQMASAGPVASHSSHSTNHHQQYVQQQQYEPVSHQGGTPQGVVPAPGTGAGYKTSKNSGGSNSAQNNSGFMYQPVSGASHASHLLAQQVNALAPQQQHSQQNQQMQQQNMKNSSNNNVQYKFYQTANQTQPINFHDPNSLLFNAQGNNSGSGQTQGRQQHQAQRI